MPKWMKDMEESMREGGVDNPYALMNDMGIMHGSKTIVKTARGAKEHASEYGRRIAHARRRNAVKRSMGGY